MFKRFVLALCVCLFFSFSSIVNAANRYETYPTTNFNTILKLDTSTGELWQVHIAVDSKAVRAQYGINYFPLTDAPQNGRFKLQATGNMYNFVLMDTIDGRVWQVQWSFNADERVILPIK